MAAAVPTVDMTNLQQVIAASVQEELGKVAALECVKTAGVDSDFHTGVLDRVAKDERGDPAKVAEAIELELAAKTARDATTGSIYRNDREPQGATRQHPTR